VVVSQLDVACALHAVDIERDGGVLGAGSETRGGAPRLPLRRAGGRGLPFGEPLRGVDTTDAPHDIADGDAIGYVARADHPLAAGRCDSDGQEALPARLRGVLDVAVAVGDLRDEQTQRLCVSFAVAFGERRGERRFELRVPVDADLAPIRVEVAKCIPRDDDVGRAHVGARGVGCRQCRETLAQRGGRRSRLDARRHHCGQRQRHACVQALAERHFDVAARCARDARDVGVLFGELAQCLVLRRQALEAPARIDVVAGDRAAAHARVHPCDVAGVGADIDDRKSLARIAYRDGGRDRRDELLQRLRERCTRARAAHGCDTGDREALPVDRLCRVAGGEVAHDTVQACEGGDIAGFACGGRGTRRAGRQQQGGDDRCGEPAPGSHDEAGSGRCAHVSTISQAHRSFESVAAPGAFDHSIVPFGLDWRMTGTAAPVGMLRSYRSVRSLVG
jgi:hypothetical protein